MTVENERAGSFQEARKWRKIFDTSGWWHSFELPDGTRIDGVNSLASQKNRLAAFPIPDDLRGKRVLDIGAWDGWFSFEMERRGAEVMAIDEWDNPRFREMHSLLNSRVDYRLLDMYDLTPSRIGRFDIVLFLGVLYHLKHPLLALERVCALTTDMAAVGSFVLREQHLPGHNIESLAMMAFYESDEFAGQTDNWVGPTLPCLLALCRTAGFARVELQNVSAFGAAVACYRRWEPVSRDVPEGPRLIEVGHCKTYAINFESERDVYLTAFFEFSEARLTRNDVQPEVGGYGIIPISLRRDEDQRWQVGFRLPPGLTPGWHEVRVRIKNGQLSNALRVAIDMPLDLGPLRITGVCDGVTWTPDRVDLGCGGMLALWINGLPENADRDNVRVYLGELRLAVDYIEAARPGQPRQVNAKVPQMFSPGPVSLTVSVGGRSSDPVEVTVAALA